ncbi:MAG TPA: hypothetical protein VKU02_20130 [Gemmataceae bacterium]|nr:hypothetical protein [Gemmataceae bacterium]
MNLLRSMEEDEENDEGRSGSETWTLAIMVRPSPPAKETVANFPRRFAGYPQKQDRLMAG